MLIVSRKINEVIEITPDESSGPSTLSQIFADQRIRIELVKIGPSRVKVAIEAPPELKILRKESRARA